MRRLTEVSAVLVLAAIITVVIALPVLRAPSDRIFGMEIVGRHHDPFTVMEQLERPNMGGVYSQPLTDVPGALLARVVGPVAAYNWLILLTFPLSAAAAYLLARHLGLTTAGATVAALAFAFSPFHLAQAAYHPHIAQTQWVPLYLLALWRCLDRPSPWTVGLLVAATGAVTLSNFYGGFIAAVITPVALLAYWLATFRTYPQPVRRLAVTAGSLVLVAGAGLAYAAFRPGAVLTNQLALAFPRQELFTYSAKWWSYLLPPVEHPLLGGAVLRYWHTIDVHEGLLEHQVSLGWGIIALGFVAVGWWLVRDRRLAAGASVPALAIVAFTAFVCSLSPEGAAGTFTFARPSAFLYDIAPMFRAYGRFGVVVQLMAALLAGIGVTVLLGAGRTRTRVVCGLLLALAVSEYAVRPAALWRDVLPTTAHRWIMDQPGRVKALDCSPFTPPSASVPWLTEQRITLLSGSFSDCAEPNVAGKLAAEGFTHLLVRQGSDDAPAFDRPRVPDGFRVAARLKDGLVFVVTAAAPAIYTAAMTGFSPRERDGQQSWRWMGADAAWTVVNTTPQPVVVTLGLQLSAFLQERELELRLDDRTLQTVHIGPARRVHQTDPFTIPPGSHALVFHAVQAPTVAADAVANGDSRPLSFALGIWRWTVNQPRP